MKLRDNDLTFDTKGPDVVESTCQFCGKQFWIDPHHGAVAHDMPMCLEFETRDVVDFLVKNRERREARTAKA